MIKMLWLHDFRRTEQGQAIVEMALILPILILLIFGIVEFGRILQTYMVVTDLSREGARAGAVGKTDLEIATVVDNDAAAVGLDTGNPDYSVTISPSSVGPRARGTPVIVQVRYSVDIIAPIIGNIIGDPYILTSQTTMRVEG